MSYILIAMGLSTQERARKHFSPSLENQGQLMCGALPLAVTIVINLVFPSPRANANTKSGVLRALKPSDTRENNKYNSGAHSNTNFLLQNQGSFKRAREIDSTRKPPDPQKH